VNGASGLGFPGGPRLYPHSLSIKMLRLVRPVVAAVVVPSSLPSRRPKTVLRLYSGQLG
jgi:hypothetical protein